MIFERPVIHVVYSALRLVLPNVHSWSSMFGAEDLFPSVMIDALVWFVEVVMVVLRLVCKCKLEIGRAVPYSEFDTRSCCFLRDVHSAGHVSQLYCVLLGSVAMSRFEETGCLLLVFQPYLMGRMVQFC